MTGGLYTPNKERDRNLKFKGEKKEVRRSISEPWVEAPLKPEFKTSDLGG